MDTESIDIKELKQISVRITCKHADEEPKIGTGTIISDGTSYYVMTAAHCIERAKGCAYKLDEIFLHTFLRGNEQKIILKEILEFTPEEKDCALLRIDKPELTFDYVDGIKRLADNSENSAKLFGYIKRKNDGRIFNLSIADESVWSVDKVAEKGHIPDEVLPGISGAGLCIKKDGIIYCIGYIKGFEDQFCSFDDVKVYPITNFSQLPSNTLVDSLSKIAVPMLKGNENKIHYNKLWNSLKVAVLNRKDFHELLKQIAEAKVLYPNSKSIHHQREVISCVLSKKEAWDDDEREVFVLAMYDCGLLPILYQEAIQNAGNLESIEEWQYLIQRQISLTCDVSKEKVTLLGDRGLYELIIRAAFCFDFARMHELLLEWSPSGMWIAKRALLMNLYQCEESDLAHKFLGEYIETGDLYLEDKFVAANIYNVIADHFPKKYNFEEFWNVGIDSTSEILSYISDLINQEKDKVKLYGIHYTTIVGGHDYTSFPESLRFLQYIINTGITTNFRYTYFVEKERWFKVYRQLFHFLPYPCIYYTLQYNDEKLVRRAAQEMAYTDEEDFQKDLPEILCKLLDAVNCEVTPRALFPSNYYFTQELYIAVKEEIWYDKFCDSILKLFCEKVSLENVSESDAIFKNVFAAINSLQTPEKRAAVFIKLVDVLPNNSRLINALICDALIVDSSMLDIVTVKTTLDEMIVLFELKDIYSILYKFQNKELLSTEQLELIDAKSMVEDMSFAEKDYISIIMLSNLVHSSKSIEALKSFILVKDIWNCGITLAHYTRPNPWHIEGFSDSILWENNEWEYIKKNMIDNLTLIKDQHDKIRHYNTFSSVYFNLLCDMRQFLIVQREKFDRNTNDVEALLNEVYSLKLGYENIMDDMSTNSYEKVLSAVLFLNQSMDSEGIVNYLPQVRMIIARVLLKKQECLYLCLSLVTCWTKKYHATMIETFGDELYQILRNFCKYDYESLDLAVPKTNKELHLLAKSLEEKYGTEATIQYWLNDPIPNRFNL